MPVAFSYFCRMDFKKLVYIYSIASLLLLLASLQPVHAQRKNPARRYEDSVAAVIKAEKLAYIKKINSLSTDSFRMKMATPYISKTTPSAEDQWLITKPVQQKSSGQNAFFYTLVVLLLSLGLVRVSFPKYFSDLFRLFFRVTLRQQSVREQLSQNKLPSLLLNILFFFSGGLFLTLLSRYYGWMPAQGFWYSLLFWSAILLIIYAFKLIIMKILSWLFHMREAGNTYSFIVFLMNKVAGILLLPFIVFIGLGPANWRPVIVTLSLMMIAGLFLYRYFISYPSVKNTVRLNRFHFIIYLWALEILPLLLIYKGLAIQLSRN